MDGLISHNVRETEALAKKILATLRGGEIIALVGDLGAGKTALVKALAKALGIKQHITSPTFVLLKVYDTKHKIIKRLVHVDCYRLDAREDLTDIGLGDYLGQPDTLVVIEWADKIRHLGPGTIWVNIDHRGDTRRKISWKNLSL